MRARLIKQRYGVDRERVGERLRRVRRWALQHDLFTPGVMPAHKLQQYYALCQYLNIAGMADYERSAIHSKLCAGMRTSLGVR